MKTTTKDASQRPYPWSNVSQTPLTYLWNLVAVLHEYSYPRAYCCICRRYEAYHFRYQGWGKRNYDGAHMFHYISFYYRYLFVLDMAELFFDTTHR